MYICTYVCVYACSRTPPKVLIDVSPMDTQCVTGMIVGFFLGFFFLIYNLNIYIYIDR